jgi:hypothetical protein
MARSAVKADGRVNGVGLHDWIDIASVVGTIAVTLLAVVLGNRISRTDTFHAEFQELKEDVASIKGFLRGKGLGF